MAGESILIVEDIPESLKFTASVLRREGYRVSIASTAEQALSTLRFLQPDLILVDFMLPGMNGLDLTTRIKQDTRLEKAVVVALTAVTEPENELRARQAGCDGYLSKPIEAGELLAHVRDFLDFGKGAPAPFLPGTPAPPPPADTQIPGLPQNELVELQESFLKAGKGVSRQLLANVEAEFDAAKASRTVHQWTGSAGLLGFPAIGERAREVETILRTEPFTPDRLRGPLSRLARIFYNPTGALSSSASLSLVRALGGKGVALIGLSGEAADFMCTALERVGARARLFGADQSPYAEAVGICHLIVLHVRPENLICRWLSKDATGLPAIPTLFFGTPENLLSVAPQAHERANGLLVDGCLPEEALMRLRLAITEPRPASMSTAAAPADNVVIAYGDTASHALIETKLKQYGLQFRLASSGPDAILLLRNVQAPVAVVDVNLDGLEALAAIRSEAMPVRTLFIAFQTQEEEILRGFSLGAEDYLVQPFSPLELIARVKKLLG